MVTRQEMMRAVQGIAPHIVNHIGMSFFDKPMTHLVPAAYAVTVAQVSEMILHNENLKVATERYRSTLRKEDKIFLPHVTPGFICADRRESSLIFPTGIHPIDFDHIAVRYLPHPKTGEMVDLVEIIKYELMKMDPYCLLAYRSPSGNGIKAFVWRPIIGNMKPTDSHRETHRALNAYYQRTLGDKYEFSVDEHGDNICHAALLAYDDKALVRTALSENAPGIYDYL